MATNKVPAEFTYARNAGADLTGKLHYLMHVDTDGDIVVAGDGEHCIGVLIEEAVANKPASVQLMGIAKISVGAAVTAGVPVASDGNGQAVAATSNEEVVGIALETSANADEIIKVFLDRGFVI